MNKLHSKPYGNSSHIQHITPQNASWEYVGFDVYLLENKQEITLDSEQYELCLVIVSGKGSFYIDDLCFESIGNRQTPFERIPPYALYIPHHKSVKIQSHQSLELAVCRAPSNGNFPVRLISPPDIGVENRGIGNNKRLVHNILPETEAADSLLVVEVFTDEGNLPRRNLLPSF